MPLNKGNTKTQGADSTFQKMTSTKKAPGSKQLNGEDVQKLEGWEDDPDMESPESAEKKDRFEKEKAYSAMMENRKKKLGVSKWDAKRKK
mgnify:CR=1 FL=1